MHIGLGLGIGDIVRKSVVENFDIERPRGAGLFTFKIRQRFQEGDLFCASKINFTRRDTSLNTSRMDLSDNAYGKINTMIQESVANAETRLMNTFANVNLNMLDLKKNTNEAIKETRYASYHARHNSKAHAKILIILDVQPKSLDENGKEMTDIQVAIQMMEKAMEGVDLGEFRLTRAIIVKVTREKFFKFDNPRPNARKPLYPDKDKLKVTFIHERDRDLVHNVIYNINGHKNFFKDMSKDDRYYFNFMHWAVDKLNEDPKGTHWYTVANNAILETRARHSNEKRKPRPEGKQPPRNPGVFSYSFPWLAAQNFGSGSGNDETYEKIAEEELRKVLDANKGEENRSQVFPPQAAQHPSQPMGPGSTPNGRGALMQNTKAARESGRAAAIALVQKYNSMSPNSMVSRHATSTPRHVSRHSRSNTFKTFESKNKGKTKNKLKDAHTPKNGKTATKRKKNSPSISPTQTLPPDNKIRKESNINVELELSVECLDDVSKPEEQQTKTDKTVEDNPNSDCNGSGSSLYDTADEDDDDAYVRNDANENFNDTSPDGFNGFDEFGFNSSLMNTTIKSRTPYKDPYDESIDNDLMKTISGENRPIEGENPLTPQEAYEIILEKHADFQDADLKDKSIILFEMASDIQILHFLTLSHKDDKEKYGKMLEWCQETLGLLSINCSAIGINSTGIEASDIEEKCRLIMEGKQVPLLTSIKPAKNNIAIARKKYLAKVEEDVKTRNLKRGILNNMLECSVEES